MLSLSKPRLNIPGSPSLVSSSEYSSKSFTIGASDFKEACKCDKHLTETVIDLRSLSHGLLIDALDGAITDQLYLVERRLVSLLGSIGSGRHSTSCHSINRPCFITCLVYIYIYLRDFPIQSPLFSNFIEKLSSSLFATDFGVMWKESSYPMLLWVLATGAIAASGRTERSRFVSGLSRISHSAGLRTFDDFMAALKKILWARRRGGALHRDLWRDVELYLPLDLLFYIDQLCITSCRDICRIFQENMF